MGERKEWERGRGLRDGGWVKHRRCGVGRVVSMAAFVVVVIVALYNSHKIKELGKGMRKEWL